MSGIFTISGIANLGGNYRNIVLNDDNAFSNRNIKEIMYSTEFGEVETLFGFTDLNIIEVDANSEVVNSAKVFLENNDFVQGVVFLDKGFLIINDLTFFSAYTKIDGVDTPYVTLVESDTYEDEEALNLIENDFRLQ